MIIQTSHPSHKTYSNTLTCLVSVLREDNSRTIFPTLLYHTITPLISQSKHILLDRFLTSSSGSPLAYSLASLTYEICSLFITMPVDTIRKRLYAQSFHPIRGRKTIDSCILLNPVPYAGFWDCARRIFLEEGGDVPQQPKINRHGKRRRKYPSRKSSSSQSQSSSKRKLKKSAWGFKGFYRGFRFRLVGLLSYSVLTFISNLSS